MCLDDYVKSNCFLPFLVAAPKSVECLVCHHIVFPGEELLCSVRGCPQVYHFICAKRTLGLCPLKKFKCPHHACFLCKQRPDWRCIRCCKASHVKCAAWPQSVTHLENQPGRAVCWSHPSDWRFEKKGWLTRLTNLLNEQQAVPATDIKDVFYQLPLPYIEEEFDIDIGWKDVTIKDEVELESSPVVDVPMENIMESSSFVQDVVVKNKMKPSPFVHIKRNLYLIKKKKDVVGDGIGCTSCRSSSTCSEDCVCRVQCISCSKDCGCCSEVCTNRPFRKEKKIKVVKTELCGWGVEAVESISKGAFVIEYVGEVIDDALCERRLWDMKFKGVQNFYMCEIRKNFTIDATFKGNSSRFLNHSCEPNCVLEKWQVEGETRVGVFAARSIMVGESLTYDYRFVQFGPEVKCYCCASKCQGYLGSKKKICTSIIDFRWGSKRKRTPQIRVAVL